MRWKRSATTELAAAVEPAATRGTVRIKSQQKPHAWTVTGGSDPGLDGDRPRYAVECRLCGETRRVGLSLAQFEYLCAYGCAREGFNGTFVRGDVVLVGDRLDQFVNYLPDGKAATTNLGGGTYIEDVASLRPKLADR